MIFENLKALEVPSVKNAVKVGDTVSDIREGSMPACGRWGVIEGSSVLGLSQTEYEALTPEERRGCLPPGRGRPSAPLEPTLC